MFRKIIAGLMICGASAVAHADRIDSGHAYGGQMQLDVACGVSNATGHEAAVSSLTIIGGNSLVVGTACVNAVLPVDGRCATTVFALTGTRAILLPYRCVVRIHPDFSTDDVRGNMEFRDGTSGFSNVLHIVPLL
jgi:hypothetical protein